MKSVESLRCCAPLLIVALATGCGSQNAPKAAPMDQKAMMEAYQKAGTPGEHHKHLQAFVGTWRARAKAFPGPDAPPSESNGTATFTSLRGGRFIEQTFRGAWDGQEFEGSGLMGYDNVQQKYVSSWADSMSTSIYTDSGSCSADGKVIDLSGMAPDPLAGKMVPARSRYSWRNPNEFVLEMWNTGADGKEYRAMEITYTRG